jgi:hypothetical protein
MILTQVGFGTHLTNWIMSCVESVSFVVLINGEAIDFFISGRGLRQGCSLSPLSFILVMEGLSLLLKESLREGKLSSTKVSRLIKILHLVFLDDVLILTNASLQEWVEIESLINMLCNPSGLKVKETKSIVHYAGLSEEELSPFNILHPYNLWDVYMGFKYLGYFLKARI